MQRPVSYSGQVFGQSEGETLRGAVIYYEGPISGQVFADDSGTYFTPGLPVGLYRLRACGPAGYLCEYYDNVYEVGEATWVSVIGGLNTEGINFILAPDTDADGDGIGDRSDNCPFVFNPD